MKKSLFIAILMLFGLSMGVGCDKKTAQKQGGQRVVSADFCADSAYCFIERQVNMGARIPNSKAHKECREWLVQKLRAYGFEAEMQEGVMMNYAGEEQKIYNIVGRIGNHEKEKSTVLLCAHYDCRPWSDNEPTEQRRQMPVMGANDGASGVGVLLEVARQIQKMMISGNLEVPNVEIVFFDVEDMGTPEFYDGLRRENTWCLGSQYWAEQADKKAYKYGVLLDMVGAPNATFYKEYYSQQYAYSCVEQVWRTAEQLGYGQYFVNERCYPLIDDHYYVNTLAGIPCIDIIHYDMRQGNFPHYWHTQQDDMRNISKETLDAVGKTILSTICY